MLIKLIPQMECNITYLVNISEARKDSRTNRLKLECVFYDVETGEQVGEETFSFGISGKALEFFSEFIHTIFGAEKKSLDTDDLADIYFYGRIVKKSTIDSFGYENTYRNLQACSEILEMDEDDEEGEE